MNWFFKWNTRTQIGKWSISSICQLVRYHTLLASCICLKTAHQISARFFNYSGKASTLSCQLFDFQIRYLHLLKKMRQQLDKGHHPRKVWFVCNLKCQTTFERKEEKRKRKKKQVPPSIQQIIFHSSMDLDYITKVR